MWLIAVSSHHGHTIMNTSDAVSTQPFKLSPMLWNTIEYVFVFQKTMV